jgi:hypothetical protein
MLRQRLVILGWLRSSCDAGCTCTFTPYRVQGTMTYDGARVVDVRGQRRAAVSSAAGFLAGISLWCPSLCVFVARGLHPDFTGMHINSIKAAYCIAADPASLGSSVWRMVNSCAGYAGPRGHYLMQYMHKHLRYVLGLFRLQNLTGFFPTTHPLCCDGLAAGRIYFT